VHTPYPIQFGDGDWITVVTNVTGALTGEIKLPDGNVVPPPEKAFDLEFAQTSKWKGDELIIISAFWDAAVQAKATRTRLDATAGTLPPRTGAGNTPDARRIRRRAPSGRKTGSGHASTSSSVARHSSIHGASCSPSSLRFATSCAESAAAQARGQSSGEQADTDDDVVSNVRDHLRADHPELVDKISDEQIRAWIEVIG
jgi:hypothetical protein